MMNRNELVAHLREVHGYGELEPGGRHHLPGDTGFRESLDARTTAELEELHEEDHEDYEDGATTFGQQPHEHA